MNMIINKKFKCLNIMKYHRNLYNNLRIKLNLKEDMHFSIVINYVILIALITT